MEHRSSPRNDSRSVRKVSATGRPITSFTASTADPFGGACVICKTVKHPLYACTHFKSFSHDKIVSILRANNLCFNCFKPGHGVKQCRSIHRFQKCQKPHHTILHYDNRVTINSQPESTESAASEGAAVEAAMSIMSNTACGLQSESILMTCRVLVSAPNGPPVEARALLDSASSASFVSERLAKSYLARARIPRYMEWLVYLTAPSFSQLLICVCSQHFLHQKN